MKRNKRTHAPAAPAPASSDNNPGEMAGTTGTTVAVAMPATAAPAAAPVAPAQPAAVATPNEPANGVVPASMTVNIPVSITNGRLQIAGRNPQTQAEIEELNRKFAELEKRTAEEAQATINAYIAKVDSIPALLGVPDLNTAIQVIKSRLNGRLAAGISPLNNDSASAPRRSPGRRGFDAETVANVDAALKEGKMTIGEIHRKFGPSVPWINVRKRDLGLTRKR